MCDRSVVIDLFTLATFIILLKMTFLCTALFPCRKLLIIHAIRWVRSKVRMDNSLSSSGQSGNTVCACAAAILARIRCAEARLRLSSRSHKYFFIYLEVILSATSLSRVMRILPGRNFVIFTPDYTAVFFCEDQKRGRPFGRCIVCLC